MIPWIFPAKYPSTCPAVLGLGSPEGLAEGPARGMPASFSSARVSGWSGQRSPTVAPPARMTGGISSRAGSTSVSGPGQNRAARAYAAG